MVKLHLELEGDVGEVVRVLRRIGGGDNADGEVRDRPRPAPTGGENSGWGCCFGFGDNGNYCNVAARPLDGRSWLPTLRRVWTSWPERVMFPSVAGGEKG